MEAFLCINCNDESSCIEHLCACRHLETACVKPREAFVPKEIYANSTGILLEFYCVAGYGTSGVLGPR